MAVLFAPEPGLAAHIAFKSRPPRAARRRAVHWAPLLRASHESLLRQNAEIDPLQLPRLPDDAELEDLMKRIKGYPLLTGYRGQPRRDTEALLAAMKALAIFANKHPELDQIELNPLLLYEKGLFALDVRIFSRL